MTDYNFQNSVKYLINLLPICRKWHFRDSRSQIFPGEHAPNPPSEFSRLWRLQFPPQFSHAGDATGANIGFGPEDQHIQGPTTGQHMQRSYTSLIFNTQQRYQIMSITTHESTVRSKHACAHI